jgi:hypothetical protein
MAQVTLYLPDDVEKLVRKRAREARTSISGYLTGLLTREVAPPRWPRALLSVLDEGRGDLAIPDDPPPEDVERIR